MYETPCLEAIAKTPACSTVFEVWVKPSMPAQNATYLEDFEVATVGTVHEPDTPVMLPGAPVTA